MGAFPLLQQLPSITTPVQGSRFLPPLNIETSATSFENLFCVRLCREEGRGLASLQRVISSQPSVAGVSFHIPQEEFLIHLRVPQLSLVFAPGVAASELVAQHLKFTNAFVPNPSPAKALAITI